MEEKLLELALKKTEEAEIFSLRREEYPVIFEANKLKSIDSRFTSGWGLRVIKDGRLGFSSATNPSVDELLARALVSAKYGEKVDFHLPRKSTSAPVKTFSPDITCFEIEDAVSIGKEIISLLREKVQGVWCDVKISKVVYEIDLLRKNNWQSYWKTLIKYSISGKLVQEEDFVFIWDGEVCGNTKLNYRSLVDKISEQLNNSRKVIKNVPTKKMRVIFTPKASMTLFQPLTVVVNGKTVSTGASPLSGRIGEKICDERITIWDDGTLDFTAGSAPFDDEGTMSQKTPIIRKGVLENFLYDLRTASLMGVVSTGNASRGDFDHMPSPSSTNLVIDAGEYSWEELVKGIGDGIIIDQLIGGGQSNVLAGEFSMNIALGFMVSNGEIIGRVKDCMVTGNIFEALSNVYMLGKDVVSFYDIHCPPIAFEQISIAGKGDN